MTATPPALGWSDLAARLEALAPGQSFSLESAVTTDLAALQEALDALFPAAEDGGFRLPEELIAWLSGQQDPAAVEVEVIALEATAGERARVAFTSPASSQAWLALFDGAPPGALAGWSAGSVGLRLGFGLAYPLEAA